MSSTYGHNDSVVWPLWHFCIRCWNVFSVSWVYLYLPIATGKIKGWEPFKNQQISPGFTWMRDRPLQALSVWLFGPHQDFTDKLSHQLNRSHSSLTSLVSVISQNAKRISRDLMSDHFFWICRRSDLLSCCCIHQMLPAVLASTSPTRNAVSHQVKCLF